MAGRRATAFTLFFGFLPYVGGGILVLLTHDLVQLAIAGVLITTFSTTGAYFLRRRKDWQSAKYWLMADPFLYGSEFVFTAVLVRYALVANR